jgi:hypothetical protein
MGGGPQRIQGIPHQTVSELSKRFGCLNDTNVTLAQVCVPSRMARTALLLRASSIQQKPAILTQLLNWHSS